ncbi:MAG: hypothetical protein ACKO5A_02435 [Actinomycetota bacterium]
MSEPPGSSGEGSSDAPPTVVRRRAESDGTAGAILGVPLRYAVALASTVVAVAVLLAAAALGRGEKPLVTIPTSAPSTTVLVIGGPPRSIELQPDWYRKGYSLYSDRGPTPTVSSLPPTTVDDDTESGSSGTASG